MSRRREILTQKEIEQFLEDLTDESEEEDQEDDVEEEIEEMIFNKIENGSFYSDTLYKVEEPIISTNEDIQETSGIFISDQFDYIIEEDAVEFEYVEEIVEANLNETQEVCLTEVFVKNYEAELKDLKHTYKDLIWEEKCIDSSKELLFTGDETLPEEISQLNSPLQIFNFLFSDDIYDQILYESNLYSAQKNVSNPMNLKKDDLKKFLGICIMTSVQKVPNTRMYWNESVGNQTIKSSMSLKSFEKIKRILHFSNNENIKLKSDPMHDRLYKIRPIVNQLVKNFQKVPFEARLSVDEQICATKIRSYMKQYNPMKPNKWGFKFWAMTGISGFLYNFEVYTGQENEKRLATENNLGASANVVIRLARNVPRHQNYILYFDNYFTTLGLVVSLYKQGIESIGTVRRNRIPNCMLPDEKNWKKEPRGMLLFLKSCLYNFSIIY